MGQWDERIRDELAASRRVDVVREATETQYSGWEPGTIVPLESLLDGQAVVMLRRFVRLAKQARVTPPKQAYREGHRVVKHSTKSWTRKIQCWELGNEHSWVLLRPDGRIALEVDPDVYYRTTGSPESAEQIVAGVNAPRPYGLSAGDVAAFLLNACRLHDMDW